jgi:hypothetical protein
MDTYRGNYLDTGPGEEWPEVGFSEEEAPREPPPSPIGQDERRMQVRAYNHWASLLDDRCFPAINDIAPTELPDFGPYSVMLDFSGGIENPAIRFLGDKLALECGTDGKIETLADVPARSLLSRITDHYMQILANQAPIGFEAEFVNQRGRTILYRGILLPFSSDDVAIDFIYGVINWKELADQATTDELLNEIDQALESSGHVEARRADPITEWADGPTDSADPFAAAPDSEDVFELTDLEGEVAGADDVLDLANLADYEVEDAAAPLDLRAVARANGDLPPLELADFAEGVDANAEESVARIELAVPDEVNMGLADWLASARDLAEAARGSEDRTRNALYQAIGKAYDFSLAAADEPEEFSELVADSGLTVQDRAPMTPVVKLVFGADYDKTRLTEYASALCHAQRIGLSRGMLAGYLSSAPGGLKGVVAQERRLKREDSGQDAVVRDCPREALAKRLRALDHAPLAAVASEGAEFTLLVARRLPTGEVVLLGEVADDIPLLEKAAKKLLG